jgi:hemoglobin
MNMKTSWNSIVAVAVLGGAMLQGCASQEKKDRDFHTSGSREADQRAEQRITKEEQLKGGEEGSTKADDKTLFARLGGERGITMLVDDFIDRAMSDPRVNWARKGVTRGGILGIGDKPVEWSSSPESVAKLKKHIAQFLALATGGPTTYEGRDMKGSHAGMKITNAEFDASIGDLKASLDALKTPTDEQKELLSIIESTRPQIVEER